MRDLVILIEADSKACRSMARKLRAEHIYCRILPASATGEDVKAHEARGILLAGADLGEPAQIPHLDSLLATGLPVLAMGDAALSLALQLGCSLGEKAGAPGVFPVRFESADDLFSGITANERYIPACRCITLSAACHPIAQTKDGVLGFRAAGKSVYALGFLPETNDPDGTQLLINFCTGICGCTLWWSRQVLMDRAREELQTACPGETEALCAISGGIDSGVCAVLGNQAIGHRLHCLFIDTGLLRKNESDEVLRLYQDTLGLNVEYVDASGEILSALQGVTNGRAKARIIHELLQEIIADRAQRMPNVKVLLQGTNYADALDSPLQASAVPEGFTIVEPVRELFKDEVRRVGEDLLLPAAIIKRQPFPDSGLALRILSEVTQEKLTILREADAIFRTEIEAAGQNKRLWQYYATLADNPTPMGAGYVIILRAVQVIDGNVAVASRLPHDLLERVTAGILATQSAVRRVLYDFTPSQSYFSNEAN
ncbi:MAG: hypothetical protein E7316_05345 [Clostridiales bacterium]|nr:hypothetical protein [Clostridiales bacterium]